MHGWVYEWVSVTSFKFWFHIKYYPAYFPCSGVNYLPWVPGRIGFQHIVTDGTDKAANCLISHMGWWQNLGQLNQQTANLVMLWKRNYENHHVMTCTGNRVNATFIPDNFDHVLIAVEIMILPAKLVKIIWILLAIHLACLRHQPGLLCGSD